MAIEEIKEFWDDLTSGAEYDPEELYEPGAPRTDHWFKDYALPVGLNALMSPFQGLKDMFIDTPTEVVKGDPMQAMKEYFYPTFGAFEGYEDQYHFPFNPELDPEFDVSAKRLTPFPGVEGTYQLPWNEWQLPSMDDLLIKMMDSGKPLISDLGMWMLSQSAGTSNLSDYTNIPGNWAAQYFGGRGLAGLALAGGPELKWLASKAYPWTMQKAMERLEKIRKASSKAIEPWGKAAADKAGFFKNIYNNWVKPQLPKAETAKQLGWNVGLPLVGHGIWGDADIGEVFDVGAATISDDWGRDSDPVVFDDYVSERMERRREPRVIRSQDEQRGPGPWNEFEG